MNILGEQKGLLPLNYKINQFWNKKNEQKIIDGNGDFEDSEDNFFVSGKVKNGLREGHWLGSITHPRINYTELYKNGELISGISVDSDKIEHTYVVPEEKPLPKKGIAHFYNHIGNNLKIPKEAEINKISGKIYLTFIIEKDGSISDIKIIKGLGHGLDEEAIRVVNSYRNWIPGKMKGIFIKVEYALPITIKLRY